MVRDPSEPAEAGTANDNMFAMYAEAGISSQRIFDHAADMRARLGPTGRMGNPGTPPLLPPSRREDGILRLGRPLGRTGTGGLYSPYRANASRAQGSLSSGACLLQGRRQPGCPGRFDRRARAEPSFQLQSELKNELQGGPKEKKDHITLTVGPVTER